MQAKVIFSEGATNPAPPSTCRGTIVKAVAATPLVSMNCRRERRRRGDGLLVCFTLLGCESLVFINRELSLDAPEAAKIKTIYLPVRGDASATISPPSPPRPEFPFPSGSQSKSPFNPLFFLMISLTDFRSAPSNYAVVWVFTVLKKFLLPGCASIATRTRSVFVEATSIPQGFNPAYI